MKVVVEKSNDYKEFKLWYKHMDNMLHTLNETQLSILSGTLISIASDVTINNELEDIKGLVKIKKMLLKVDNLLASKQSLNN